MFFQKVEIRNLPDDTPQLSKVIFLRGASGSILTTQAESNTVYSLKVEVLRKWKIGFPSLVENLHFPSFSITLLNGFTLNFLHRFVLSHLQHTQYPHSPLKMGTTWSPSSMSVTPSPTLSTILYNKIGPNII